MSRRPRRDRRRDTRPTVLGLAQGQLRVPVLAATGGAGRSTVAALLAQAMAPTVRTVVLDAGYPPASPWPGWLARPATIDTPVTAAEADPQRLFAGLAAMRTVDGANVQVLTPAATAPGGGTVRGSAGAGPVDVEAGGRFATLLGHPAVVVDTDTDLLHTPPPGSLEPGEGTNGPDRTVTQEAGGFGWLQLADAAPVLCLPASPKGVDDAALAVTALEDAGWPTGRLSLAVVGIAATDLPRRVLAGLTLLEARVAGIIRIPHDPRIRATGRPALDRASKRLRRAVADLTHTLVSAAPQRPAATAHVVDSHRLSGPTCSGAATGAAPHVATSVTLVQKGPLSC